MWLVFGWKATKTPDTRWGRDGSFDYYTDYDPHRWGTLVLEYRAERIPFAPGAARPKSSWDPCICAYPVDKLKKNIQKFTKSCTLKFKKRSTIVTSKNNFCKLFKRQESYFNIYAYPKKFYVISTVLYKISLIYTFIIKRIIYYNLIAILLIDEFIRMNCLDY